VRNKYLLIMLAGLILLTGCGEKEKVESKSLDQIYREEGVPVKVMEIAENYFGKSLQYSGRLSGINQGTEQSMVGGKVESILFSVGDYVEEGEVVLTFPEDLAGMNYQAVKANYDVMAATYERLSKLQQDGGMSQQNVDNAEAGYLAAQSQLATVEQMLKVMAPMSGYITAIYVSETDYLESGDLLFTVSELERLKTKIAVTEKEINLFSKGIKAIAKWENLEYNGEVTSVGFAMNSRNGAFEVELEFANPQKYMKFNINAIIEVEVYNNPQAITVEKKHILRDSGGDYVYVAQGDKAVKRYVITGEYSGVTFEILEGLQVGEKLVVEGRDLLEDGSLIKVSR